MRNASLCQHSHEQCGLASFDSICSCLRRVQFNRQHAVSSRKTPRKISFLAASRMLHTAKTVDRQAHCQCHRESLVLQAGIVQ